MRFPGLSLGAGHVDREKEMVGSLEASDPESCDLGAFTKTP
jgi:hypothetical protein